MGSIRATLVVLGSREVLVSLFLIGLVGTGFGLTTMGSFQDEDRSGSNAVDSGTLDLKLDGGDGGSALFSLTNAAPNDSTTANVTLTNVGSLSADHVEVALSLTENDTRSEPSDSDLAAELNATETASLVRVTTFAYKADDGTVSTDLLSSVSDDNGNGILDLQDVQTSLGTADNLAAPQANSANETYLVLTIEIASDEGTPFVGSNTAGNLTGVDEDVMADGIDIEVIVRLNQESNQ